MKRPVVIGGGHLGGSVARGLFKAGHNPIVVQHRGTKADALSGDGLEVVESLGEVSMDQCGTVFIAILPSQILSYCRDNDRKLESHPIVSCAAMVSLERLSVTIPGSRWARVMPNVASEVGAGLTGVTRGSLNDAEYAELLELTRSFGSIVECPESDLDAIIALSGSAIAYILELLDGYIQGGLSVGMSAENALQVGMGTLIGAAELVREGRHPAILRDSVCTPAGITIAGVRSLNRAGFKNAFIEALVATAEKSIAATKQFNSR